MGKKKDKKKAKKLAKKSESTKSLKKAKSSKKKKKTAECDGLQVCPCCKKHCPLTSPKCGKGRKLAKKLGA